MEVLLGASLCFRYTKTVAIGISDCAIAFAYQAYGKGQYLLRNLSPQELESKRIRDIMAKHVINNPGGRKPLPEEEKYGKPIPVRFTPKQFVRIKRKAGEMPISTYIREGALHAIVRQPVSKELMKEIRDLNNLGTNINTLVKLAHQAGFMVIADKANEALDGVNAILHQARLKIKEKEDEQENQS